MSALEHSVFIGSSSEGRMLAELVQDVLTAAEWRSLGWWEPGVFQTGETFIESLHRILGEHNAGLFVATPDDLSVIREKNIWTARGNVLLEYGMFSGVHGRHRVALAVAGEVELPSDLDGVAVIRLDGVPHDVGRKVPSAESRRTFIKANREKLQTWIAQLTGRATVAKQDLFNYFPQLADVLVASVRRMKTSKDDAIQQRDLDLLASDMIGSIAATFDADNFGMNESLVEKVSTLLVQRCTAIHAVDVVGPKAWIHPRTYRYLAPQIKRYIQSNTSSIGAWNLQVSPALESAIKQALACASSQVGLRESRTNFDNPEYLVWHADKNPRFEFSRTLLWSKSELLSPIAEAVIAIHVAFNVPLFYLEREEQSSARDVDYILFLVEGKIDGYYGLRANNYETKAITMGRIPKAGDPLTAYHALWQDGQLMLAHDARHVALENRA